MEERSPGGEGKSPAGRLVVGVDDSEQARRALACAAAIAEERGWELRIVHGWHISYPAAPFVVPPVDIQQAGRSVADSMVARLELEVLGETPAIEVSRRVEEGSPAGLLVDESRNASLLVVGSRGRGGFASLTLGSVSSACVHHAHCPVLVLRGK